MDYFPHDTDATNDEKIEALRALHGNDGYAFYFIILERIYRSATAELDVSKPAVLAALIVKLGVSKEKFNEILKTAFDVGCLNKDRYETDQVLTSNGIKKRAKEVTNLRNKWKKNKANPLNGTVEHSSENMEDNSIDNSVENSQEMGEIKPNKIKLNQRKLDKIEKYGHEDTACANVFRVYQNEIGLVSPLAAEKLDDWIDTYSPEWVVAAISEAATYNARSPAYIGKVLEGWIKYGFKVRPQKGNKSQKSKLPESSRLAMIENVKRRMANDSG